MSAAAIAVSELWYLGIAAGRVPADFLFFFYLDSLRPNYIVAMPDEWRDLPGMSRPQLHHFNRSLDRQRGNKRSWYCGNRPDKSHRHPKKVRIQPSYLHRCDSKRIAP
jgi:hypothetical protein